MKTVTRTAWAVAAAMLTSTTVLASTEGPPSRVQTVRGMVEQADLVFQGVVERIEYALSLPGGQEGARVPHTFVTYRVDRVLSGADPGSHVTLRFIGGLHLENQTVMMSSITPRFDEGDEDILFVKDNGSSMSPLVGNRKGRFRVIDGQLYTEMGNAVRLDGQEGAIRTGRKHRLVEVETTTIHGQVFRLDLGPEAIDGPSDAIGEQTLVDWVTWARMNANLNLGAFISADPGMPFNAPDMMPAAPPPARPGEADERRPKEITEIGPQQKHERK